MPKRPPPGARSAQNSSGSRCSSHSTATLAADGDLRTGERSPGQPVAAAHDPSPPPSVSPAIPTSGPQPAGIVTPCSSRASYTLPSRAPC